MRHEADTDGCELGIETPLARVAPNFPSARALARADGIRRQDPRARREGPYFRKSGTSISDSEIRRSLSDSLLRPPAAGRRSAARAVNSGARAIISKLSKPVAITVTRTSSCI